MQVTWKWEWEKRASVLTGTLVESVEVNIEPPVKTHLLKVQAGPRKKGQRSHFAWTVELLPASTKQRFNIVTAEAAGEAVKREVEQGALKMVRYMASEWARLVDRLPPEPAPPARLATSYSDALEQTTRGDTMVEEMRGMK